MLRETMNVGFCFQTLRISWTPRAPSPAGSELGLTDFVLHKKELHHEQTERAVKGH
jgi:hypothetical protein